MLGAFDMFSEGKQEGRYVPSKFIYDVFKYLDIEISPRHIEYLVMNLYELSNDIKKLDYKEMFKLFPPLNELENIILPQNNLAQNYDIVFSPSKRASSRALLSSPKKSIQPGQNRETAIKRMF